MKKIIKIISVTVFVVAVLFISLLYYFFGTKSETVKIRNEKLNEIIYLKQYSRGLNFELNVISTKRWYTKPDISKEIVGMDGYPFFYKLSNDTLHIYGSSWENIEHNILKTPIVYHELSNDDYLNLSRDMKYKKLGMNYFPQLQEEFIND